MPRAPGDLIGGHADKYFALEDVVGNVDAHEQSCVKHYRGGREPGARNPCRCSFFNTRFGFSALVLIPSLYREEIESTISFVMTVALIAGRGQRQH